MKSNKSFTRFKFGRAVLRGFLVLVLLSVFALPAFAQASTPAPLPPGQSVSAETVPPDEQGVELSTVQITAIGIVATVLAQVIKLLAAQKNFKVGRQWVTVVMFAIALILAYVWAKPVLPVFPPPVDDPGVYAGQVLDYFGQIITLGSGIVGFAVVAYNLLLQKFFDAVGLGQSKIDELMPPENKPTA